MKREAKKERGIYVCANCKKLVPVTEKIEGERRNNVTVDHILPVVDVKKGFTTWDEYIEKLFCEKVNLQLLCRVCHDEKTKVERKEAAINRKERKDNDRL